MNISKPLFPCNCNIQQTCDYCRNCIKCNNCKCVFDLKKFDKKYIMNNCSCFIPDIDNICIICNGCKECSSKFSCICIQKN